MYTYEVRSTIIFPGSLGVFGFLMETLARAHEKLNQGTRQKLLNSIYAGSLVRPAYLHINRSGVSQLHLIKFILHIHYLLVGEERYSVPFSSISICII